MVPIEHRRPSVPLALLLTVATAGVGACGPSDAGDPRADVDTGAIPDAGHTDVAHDASDTPDDGADTSDTPSIDPRRVRVDAPSRQVPGGALPFRVTAVRDDGSIAVDADGSVTVQVADTRTEVSLRRGVGSATVVMPASPTTLTGPHSEDTRTVETSEVARSLGGELSDGALSWGPDEVIEVVADVTVPADTVLSVAAGTTVLLAADANVTVLGDIAVTGTAADPVLWAPATAGAAWGGITVHGEGTFAHSFFVAGGGDDARAWGHSGSQPVVFAEPGSTLSVDHCVFQDAPGKAMGSLGATVTVSDTLVTRVDTGGEFRDSFATVLRTYYLDMPTVGADPTDPVNDDNDTIYFWGTLDDESGAPLASSVTDCVFMGGLDDAIDHNGAVLDIDRVWIEGFLHEGIAASNGGSVRVSDAWITGCQQGIEVGGPYGGPLLQADHVVLVRNDRNIRWGDSSDPDFASTIEVTNSVVAEAVEHTVLNYHVALGGPNPAADVRISASLVDDPDWSSGDGTILGEPTFSDAGLLVPGTPGAGAAADGSSFGLRAPLGW